MKTRFLFLMAICMLAVTTAMAQITVKGQVLSATDGESLIGAAIQEVGTSNGTVSDVNGNFSLKVKEGASLKVSYVGYIPQTLKAKANLVVKLQEDTKTLDDVVVIGYGVQKKSDLTGAVGSVKEADLKNRATSDAAAALQGKVAGVQILTSSGAPGGGSEIRVRGVSSNSGELGPLLIVDGLKVDNIQYLDPEMIESIEVLKDAASAAIYGVQAGNGVVLITTKNGKGQYAESGRIFYNAQFQLSSLARKPKVLNAADYIAYGKEQGFLSDEKLAAYGYNGEDVCWADEVFEPTWSNRHTVGFQGANEKGSLFAAINNIYNNGIFVGDKDVYKRLSFQVNAEYKIKPWLTVGTNNSIEKYKTKSVSQQNDNGTALLASITTDPLFGPLCTDDSQLTLRQQNAIASGIAVLQNENGQYYRVSPVSGETQSSNPFIKRDAIDGYNEGLSLRGNAYLNFNPIKELVFTSRFGYRLHQSNSHSYEFPFEANEFVRRTTYLISANANNSYYYNWENFINFNKTFAEKHNFGAMLGMSYEERHSDNVSASSEGENILSGYAENFRYLDYVTADAPKSIGNAPSYSRNMAYFGRLTYNYDSRYYIQANFRADAFDSAYLPSAERWGYFPSFSAGWTVSNEKFFKDNVNTDTFNFLKIRASWGKNGNINVLRGYPYEYATVINANTDWYQYEPYNSTLSYGSVTNGLPNPNLKWETSKQIDLGLDARFFNNRLTVGIDWFKKTTEGLLVNVTPVIETGVGRTMLNAGDVENSGFEVEVGWQDRIGDLKYSVNANLSTLHNEMTYLDPTVDRIPGVALQGSGISTVCMPGHSLWFLRGYEVDHIDKTTGEAVFKDINGDGVWNADDMTDLGCGLPKVTYGITVNLEYKGFDFTLFGTGAAGQKILPQAWRSDRPYCNNYDWFYHNSWTANNTNAAFPAVSKWSTDVYSSNLTVFNGSYFKIKTIQLGYTIPKNITKKFFVSDLRVFASLENFFTFTDYVGLDPEAASQNSSNGMGIDMGTYPTAKQFILGFNLSF
ncbi:MAG: TonB-dependent receptor [Bacteroidaceae bacterium]|nr:TonB-dependent receptor [Bacteroidaceae bacterium]